MTALVERLEEPLLSDAFEERRITDGALAERLAKERRSAATALRANRARIEELEEYAKVVEAQLRDANIERDEQTQIVANIWKLLGSPTYEELAGRSIYDLIAASEARALAAEAQVASLADDVVALAEHCGELANLSDGPCPSEGLCGEYACEQIGCIKDKADRARQARSTLLSVGGNSSSRSQMSSARDQSLARGDAEPSAPEGDG